MVAGDAGSSLVTVSVADLAPKLVGAKRIGIARESPGPIVSGYANTCGTRNSAEVDVISVTVSVHLPLLQRTSGSSAKEPTQVLAKFPVLAMTRLNLGARATPETAILCGPFGSSLMTVTIAFLGPNVVGAKRITTSVESPGPTSSG